MQFKTIAALFTLAAAIGASAQDIDNNDVSHPCRAVCQSVVALTTDCDRRTNDDDDNNDTAYRDCICQAPDALADVPNCAACVAANGGTDLNYDDDDNTPENDVVDIIRACSFPTWITGAASTSAPTTTGTGTLGTAGSTRLTTTTGTGTAGATTATTTATGTGGATQFAGAAAPVPTAGAIKYFFGLAALAGLPAVAGF